MTITLRSHFEFFEQIAAAGKAVYNLPMYVNAALNRPGWKPGQYPSAGPLPHVIDIWKAGAPSIDLFAPDIYFPDLKRWCDLYTRSYNPLFIPEIRFENGVDAKAFGGELAGFFLRSRQVVQSDAP